LTLTKPWLGAWLRAVTLGELLGCTSTALIAFVALMLDGHPTTIPGRVAVGTFVATRRMRTFEVLLAVRI
jgi:hypothetical protein